MRRLLTLTLAVIAAAAMTWAADDTLGAWKYNTAKSEGVAGVSPYTNLTLTREAIDGGVKTTGKGERADGTKIDTVTTAKYDGKPVTVTGTGLAYDTVATKQVNANTVTEERTKQGTKYHVTARRVVSADGKTMTVTMKGNDADGKPISSTVVWDRQ